MKSLSFLLVILLSNSLFADLFVAPNGNDSSNGTLAAPFATIAKALEAARSIKPPPTIFIRGGTYSLDKPLSFSAADSNLTIAAYQNEIPIFSGGRRITGWKKDDRGW